MDHKVRINLANAQELLELPGLSPSQAAAIIRFRAEHGPITDAAQLSSIVSAPMTRTLRERADFAPADSTAPEAPGA